MNDQIKPTVSVIMPVYNVELYVAEAINSILNQTFTDFELIVLDDCSPDRSAEIVKSFIDKRIVYHRNEKNQGLAENLNTGLKMAKGKYIARMDGDDVSLPERLMTQVKFLDEHLDIDLCSCALEMFGHDHQIWIRDADPEQVKITMLFYSPVLHATSVWRKSSFDDNGLFYDQNMFPAEDYDLWSRAVFKCKLVNIPDILYRYRIHGIQVTKTDDRAAEKILQIQVNYLMKSLPSLKEDSIRNFVSEFLNGCCKTKLQVSQLKVIYHNLLNANDTDLFFRRDLLKKNLNKYYRSIVFEFLNSNSFSLGNWRLYFDLNFRQFVKLIK